jgi:hypothetical protein
VRDAAFSAYWSADQEAPNDELMIAAATLRAAAEHVVHDRVARMELRLVADELEGLS